jgi:hypothetical protein
VGKYFSEIGVVNPNAFAEFVVAGHISSLWLLGFLGPVIYRPLPKIKCLFRFENVCVLYIIYFYLCGII